MLAYFTRFYETSLTAAPDGVPSFLYFVPFTGIVPFTGRTTEP